MFPYALVAVTLLQGESVRTGTSAWYQWFSRKPALDGSVWRAIIDSGRAVSDFISTGPLPVYRDY